MKIVSALFTLMLATSSGSARRNGKLDAALSAMTGGGSGGGGRGC